MGIFDPFGDIDNTKEGHVYVVDHKGWGWFAIFVLLALPFFMVSLMLRKYANAVCEHPVVAILIYGLLTLIVTIMLYGGGNKRFRFLGVVATMMTMLPMAAVQVCYAIPYILINDGFFTITFEWLLVTFFSLSITVFVLSIGNLCQNGIIHFLLAAAFVVATAWILEPPDSLSWDYILQLYFPT